MLPFPVHRSGKTSIQQMLFNDADPKQTFYFEPTIRIMKHKHDTIIPLEIWDCPGNITVDTLGAPLSTFALIIFVIDIQAGPDSVQQPIARLLQFFTAAFQESPATALEVFVHKAEAIQEYKNDSFRHIQGRIIGELEDMPGFETMPLDFHLTSIYDYSLYESFSELITKVVDSLPDLEQLLDIFCANSQASKAYLFDIKSRLYVATDTSPPDSAHKLCCDYLKTMNSFGSLYK
ncbi:uncharacterized protein STEHIDRAFT_66536 [Stereum hirsutum FP-91666 SS1]|uniref:uncharacterized protein n=1 Tax=Stereum hirsutum (strain FP-91666) TaxID=721885 RepID=UPI0004449AB1|nr:uncharacterized protein STEHIDRAFT_66536 [Stereum hirsutum FP-91666 SS1]EIM81519.1 hypothetical protein STEHIDRAFT_66536 [Stereum hirsutum FP-91666 SS1]